MECDGCTIIYACSHIYTQYYISRNAVLLMWGSLRLAPNMAIGSNSTVAQPINSHVSGHRGWVGEGDVPLLQEIQKP